MKPALGQVWCDEAGSLSYTVFKINGKLALEVQFGRVMLLLPAQFKGLTYVGVFEDEYRLP